MTADELARLKELESKATESPWECAWAASRVPIATAKSTDGATDGKPFGLYGATMVPTRTDADLELAAALRTAAPALIALAEKAKDKIKTAINNLDELDPEQRGMFTSMAESCLVEALAAYPEGE